MKVNILNTRFLLASFHLVLGVLLLSGMITKIYSALIVVFGVLFIIRAKNDENQAIFWSAYMIGAEVLFRMSGGMVFHELPKYSVLLFLGVGLWVEKRRHHISVGYLIYILLLLIGIAFMDLPFDESIRKAIAFNLSGPVLLGLSAIYFYKRPISLTALLNLLFVMGLPIISMLSLLYFKTPDIENIRFGGEANFAASGGFGPNQVATILGLGVFVFAIHLVFKRRIFSFFGVDFFFLVYITYRGVLTFSRGGILTALIALSVFIFYYVLVTKNQLKNLFKYLGLTFLFGIFLMIYTVNITDGMIINRYTNKNAAGIAKNDFTTGRLDILKAELEGFFDNPYFGLGVGGSKFYRLDKLDKLAASHNEIGRLISEHGMVGVLILIILLAIPTRHILKQPFLARGFLGAFLLFWFLTINHSAMRIAFPAFIYGLSVAKITFKELEISKVASTE
ncbi:O-antigen ligase [uncultured Lutibacter sp.]|uniref:O-antigen ligase family protein n=1 Tax=uncultured Lutibacter sp. TaxID=437739 RepID=UPI00260E5EEC|nr:O-antigen ligase family protein [uncultured Lutibacter sp.]